MSLHLFKVDVADPREDCDLSRVGTCLSYLALLVAFSKGPSSGFCTGQEHRTNAIYDDPDIRPANYNQE